jgi:hypothetical protein
VSSWQSVEKPLLDARAEVARIRNDLNDKANALLGLKDLSNKKRKALLTYRVEFDVVLDFIDLLGCWRAGERCCPWGGGGRR